MNTSRRSVLQLPLSCTVILMFLCGSMPAGAAPIVDDDLRETLIEALKKQDPGRSKKQDGANSKGQTGESKEQTGEPKENTPVSRAFSLVNSGGVSLGVYEAGVNWALLRLLKDLRDDPAASELEFELYAAAGASAGAINGFLAGLFWCTEAYGKAEGGDETTRDTLNANLFRDSWVSIDVNELIDHSADFLPEDNAAFSRSLLREIQSALKDEMDARKFLAGCQVAFGLSLTRSSPVLVSHAGVDIAQQRLVLPLIMTGGTDGKLLLENFRMPPPDFSQPDPAELADRPFRSSVIYLDGGKGFKILESALEPDAVFAAIKASSSFPVAFAPMKLSYCIIAPQSLRRTEKKREREQPSADKRCPDEYRRLSSYFVDGGVFDNDPVELVRQLSKQRQQQSPGKVKALYVKIDPGKRRPPAGLFRFEVPPYAQVGDSLEVSMWAGVTSAGQGRFRTVQVLHCRAGSGGSDEHELTLTESSRNSHYFIGTLHTRARPGEESTAPGQLAIGVEPDDRLLVYDPEEEFQPQCERKQPDGVTQPEKRTHDDDRLQARTRSRTISILRELPPGLSTQLRFLGGSVSSARGYRLYDELMSNNWRDGAYGRPLPDSLPLFQPARLTPLVGDFLFSFAAFIDERFRKFDYYAGVYDAVYGVAEFLCLAKYGPDGDRNNCRAWFAEKIYLHLCAPDPVENRIGACRTSHPDANAVLYQMIVLEVCGAEVAEKVLSKRCELGRWNWVEQLTPSGTGRGWSEPSRDLLIIGETLQEANLAVRDTDRDSFVHFVKALATRRNNLEERDTGTGEVEANQKREKVFDRMLAHSHRPVPTWYYPVSRSLVPQLLELENEDKRIRDEIGVEPAAAREIIKPVLALGGLYSESVMRDPHGWLPDQTSVPDDAKRRWLASFFPSELAIDPRNGGWGFYWRPAYRTRGTWGVDFRIAPYVRQGSAGETVELAEATAFVTRRLENPLVSSVGIGPTVTHIWGREFARDDRLGVSVSVGLLAEKLKLTYGVRSFDSGAFAGDDTYWHMGINDLPGIFYWACRGIDRAPAAISWLCGVH